MYIQCVHNVCEYADHILFIHSPVHGQLGCFHLLATANNAALTALLKYVHTARARNSLSSALGRHSGSCPAPPAPSPHIPRPCAEHPHPLAAQGTHCGLCIWLLPSCPASAFFLRPPVRGVSAGSCAGPRGTWPVNQGPPAVQRGYCEVGKALLSVPGDRGTAIWIVGSEKVRMALPWALAPEVSDASSLPWAKESQFRQYPRSCPQSSPLPPSPASDLVG